MTRHEVRVNGAPRDSISVADRAVQYGDGLFETMRVEEGRALHLARHLARLKAGCERLHIVAVDLDALAAEIVELAAGAGHGAAVLKVIVSRGRGTRGYGFAAEQAPTRIVSLSPLPQWPADIASAGIRARICSTRLALQPALAGIKHLNRLEQILARAEWTDPGINEGLMLDREGRLVEGTMSNLFLVRDGELATPDLAACGVAGIMRSVILDFAARHGIPCGTGGLTLDDAGAADEVFVCNSLIGIWPVGVIDGIGRYDVGPVTRMLLAAPGPDDSNGETWYPS